MHRIKPDVDVIKEILETVIAAKPHSVFVNSLLKQYIERGGLSKKQLQGLHGHASKIKEISVSRLATLEAIILKKPTRYTSSELPAEEPLFIKDEATGKVIHAILEKYPQHKRVLFFQSKYDNNEVLTAAEQAELNKFSKLLLGSTSISD
jgi:hypothetical protein